MPELPEVETIKNLLRTGGLKNPPLLGLTITSAQLLWLRSLVTPTPQEFLASLPDQTIREIERRGKFLIFRLSRQALLIHLRMSGDLFVETPDAPIALHYRLVINLEGPSNLKLRLVFNDARKFGRLWFVEDPQEILAGLGPEPLDPAFTAQLLYLRLHASHRQLKPLLLDQTFLAGLGNIYADEALHLAHLHPLMLSHQVTLEQATSLWMSIRQTLKEGIRRNGASIDWVYRGGDFQNYFRVYQRTGQPCPECGTPIQRLVVGQRGTHICPQCQVLDL